MEKIALCFIEQNEITECTDLVLEFTRDAPEEADLQTKILVFNVKNNSLLAEDVLKLKKFTHYDREEVAKVCEERGLYNHAFSNYGNRSDQERVL